MIKDLISPYTEKKCKIKIGSSESTMNTLDWEQYVAEHKEFMKKISGMNYEQMDEFFEKNISTLILVLENFLDEEYAGKVLEGELIPFAILGMSDTLGALSDMSNNGVLLFDMTSGSAEDPAVLWFKEGQVTHVAGAFSELQIRVE